MKAGQQGDVFFMTFGSREDVRMTHDVMREMFPERDELVGKLAATTSGLYNGDCILPFFLAGAEARLAFTAFELCVEHNAEMVDHSLGSVLEPAAAA